MRNEKHVFLPAKDSRAIDLYNKGYAQMLRQQFDEEEALRYEYLEPLREYIRTHYTHAEPTLFYRRKGWPLIQHRMFGQHIVFERKTDTSQTQP